MAIAQFGDSGPKSVLVRLPFFCPRERTIVLKKILAQLPFRIEPMLLRPALGTSLHLEQVAGKNPDILAV